MHTGAPWGVCVCVCVLSALKGRRSGVSTFLPPYGAQESNPVTELDNKQFYLLIHLSQPIIPALFFFPPRFLCVALAGQAVN